MANIDWKSLNVGNCLFLGFITGASLTAVPAYIWKFGLPFYLVAIFLVFFVLTGMGITLGYHRLFSHKAFEGHWLIKLGTLLFGAAAFENSALNWSSDHRRHHKFCDHDDDPYNAKKGLWWSHIGWILKQQVSPNHLKLVPDLQKDSLVMWQDRHYGAIAFGVGFLLPGLIGSLFGGWVGFLGGVLIGGVARGVCVQQFTFFINSACHKWGTQPYSDGNTARDSAFLALFTFGEGYHNYHHAFQHDYRNGVKPWQFDPTKWAIWIFHKLGLAHGLRRVADERIIQSQISQKRRLLERRIESCQTPMCEKISARFQAAQAGVEKTFQQWEEVEREYRKTMEKKAEASREKLSALRQEFLDAKERLQAAFQEWNESHQMMLSQFAT